MTRSDIKPGFTLPAVLLVVAALLILAVGGLLITGVERDTARSFVERQRAELAARAGLEDFHGILAKEAANDDFLIIRSTLPLPSTSNAPHLFLARGQKDGDEFRFRYIPLFSAMARPPESELKAPEIDEQITGGNDQYHGFSTLPYQDNVRATWLPVKDEKDRVVARYAYWVEDLQSRVDPAIAGNNKGDQQAHERVEWPFPAPGVNDRPESAAEPALNQIATFALDPDATGADQKSLGKTLFKNRKMMVSPDSVLAAGEFEPPLERDANRNLVDERADAVEKGLVTGIRSYQERALVPFSKGIDPSVAGEPKLNLNKLLTASPDSAVDDMADFISEALPDFGEERKGGFPDDYVKTIAANALDYADDDNDPRLKDGQYRGIDGYPLVSEFLLKPRIESVSLAAGRRYVNLSVTVYVELWNMTNVPVQGKAEISYETKYGVRIEPNSSGNPNPFYTLDDMSKASPAPGESNGYRWLPSFDVNLQPNEYRVHRCGMVTYALDIEDDSDPTRENALNTIVRLVDDDSRSGYRMRWDGKMTDQSRGNVLRGDTTIHYRAKPEEQNTLKYMQQQVRGHVSGHTCRIAADQFFNMGDARMAYYIQAPQAANGYPQNYSPNRRNIRMGSYLADNNRVAGRVLPSEWPDGGHDSEFGTESVHGLLGMDFNTFDGDQRINPDDARFFNQLPDLTLGKEEAPTRLSNLGRFYSVTELGRAYDPVMWLTLGGTNPGRAPGQSWGNVNVNNTASEYHGGGNTLRIGRREHPKFNEPGLRASHLLDLFHTGISGSDDPSEREGDLVKINGHVNINTASRQALRQMVAGALGQDPEIRSFTGGSHADGSDKFPENQKLSGDNVPDVTAIADRIASGIIGSRPYASTGELAKVSEFGNPDLFPQFSGSGFPSLQWTDSAAEEAFARAFDASTVRSRNFRVWVIGQSLAPSTSVTNPTVLAEIRKAYTVFADPGERKADGSPDPAKFRLKILHESDF